jgi:DNA-binding MarR family transcriptional regulator
MQLANNIGYLLYHLSSAMARQSDQLLQERLEIGLSQYKILLALQQSSTRQRQIADLLGQTEASISRQIKLMYRLGLLERKINPANKRERIISLTNKGGHTLEAASRVLNSAHAPILNTLSTNQKLRLAGTLNILHQHVCETGKTGTCRQYSLPS